MTDTAVFSKSVLLHDFCLPYLGWEDLETQNLTLGWRGVGSRVPSRRQAVLALSGSIKHALGSGAP